MVHTIEFHGRLSRADGRPANPGSYDLLFRLHVTREADGSVWEEVIHEIPVASGGFYHVVLGGGSALRPSVFEDGPRWLSVSVLRPGKAPAEMSERVALTGITVRLGDALGQLDGRLSAMEARPPSSGGGGLRAGELGKHARRIRILHRRLKKLEAGGGPLVAVLARLDDLERRVRRLDGEDGRFDRIEDELEDLVGPDGDVVDLTERLVALEAHARAPTHVVGFPEGLAERLDALQARLDAIEGKAAPAHVENGVAAAESDPPRPKAKPRRPAEAKQPR
ncbi:MAG: hypothetical protein ACOZNI_37330 [Myxococcota bacterium]